MSVPLLVFLVAALVLFMVVVMAWANAKAEERRAVWRQVAERRGGIYHPPTNGIFSGPSEAIELRVGHAIVRLDLYVVSTGKSSTTYTRARARFALGRGPVFKVYEEGVFSTLGKALGTQDLELGSPRFDGKFMVKGDDVEEVRRVWTPAARRLMTSRLSRASAQSDGREVRLVMHGAASAPEPIDAMVDLAGELASDLARELEPLAELEGAQLTEAKGSYDAPEGPSLRLAADHGVADAVVVSAGRSARLRLTMSTERALPSFEAELGDAEGLPRELITDRAATLLPRLTDARLSADDRGVALDWPAVPAPDEVARGARLLSEIAGGSRSVGAFR